MRKSLFTVLFGRSFSILRAGVKVLQMFFFFFYPHNILSYPHLITVSKHFSSHLLIHFIQKPSSLSDMFNIPASGIFYCTVHCWQSPKTMNVVARLWCSIKMRGLQVVKNIFSRDWNIFYISQWNWSITNF